MQIYLSGGGVPAAGTMNIFHQFDKRGCCIERLVRVLIGYLHRFINVHCAGDCGEQLHSLLTAITISASNTVQEKYWEHKPNLLPSCKNYYREYRVNHSVFKIFWHSCKQFRFLKNFVGIKTSDIECYVESLKRQGVIMITCQMFS